MKTVLKILLGLVLLVLIIAAAGYLYINSTNIPSYEVEELKFKARSDSALIARGEKLGSLLCAGCHLNPETGKLTGKHMKDAAAFGEVYSQNITQDKEYGIGNWTDGEILYLLRTGVLPNGRYTPPYMAKLPHMADEDIEAIIAWLHSDDPRVQANAAPDKACKPNFLAKFLCQVAFKPLPLPDHSIETPDTTNKLALGKYLTTNLDCWTCHSASFETINVLEPEKSVGFCGGGNPIPDMDGNIIVSANITFDETGIASWSEEKFVRAIKTGIVQGQDALRYPMVPYTKLTDYEASAIYVYLKSLPHINNDVKSLATN